MIEVLKAHRDLIGTIIKRLQRAGIRCERTYGNDPNGDLLVVRLRDVPRVQKLIATWGRD